MKLNISKEYSLKLWFNHTFGFRNHFESIKCTISVLNSLSNGSKVVGRYNLVSERAKVYWFWRLTEHVRTLPLKSSTQGGLVWSVDIFMNMCLMLCVPA